MAHWRFLPCLNCCHQLYKQNEFCIISQSFDHFSLSLTHTLCRISQLKTFRSSNPPDAYLL